MTKAELRKIYLEKRKSLTTEESKRKSELIAESFFQNFDVSKFDFLHSFLPIEKFNEIDTRIIFEKIWLDFPNVQTLVPRVNFQKNEIENLLFLSETETEKNVWKIDEPVHNETVETEKINAVLVPLLCFDKCGFRVGYGKGFYDRFLISCRTECVKIGLNFFASDENISDIDEFDVPLDYLITPDKIWDFQSVKRLFRS